MLVEQFGKLREPAALPGTTQRSALNEPVALERLRRSGPSPSPHLHLTSPHLSLNLEATECSLLGQIIPPRAGTLETHITAGVSTSPVDQIGYFAVKPIPASPFRLRFGTADGIDVLTGWITL
jgi:hypothetical protein